MLSRHINPAIILFIDLTDFERNINLRQAVTENLEDHIEALDDIDSAQVTLVLPEDSCLLRIRIQLLHL